MPIYEYECPDCGRFEVIQKISANTLEECPRCKENGKQNSVRKAVSASAFHLKGGGWYKTDYGSSSTGGSSSSGSSTATSSASTDSSSSQSSTSDTSSNKACGTGCGCH